VSTVDGVEDAAGRAAAPEAVVLETKLTRPRVRSEHVPRRALLSVLRSGSCRLTLVVAPPGFGKTTLLAEWAGVEEEPHRSAVAWLSVDEHDNDPARFFHYMLEALRREEPELGGRALAALRVPGAALPEVVLPLLLNDQARLDRELVLVIDDYHLITNPEIHEALTYLIERSPPNFRLVLATREDPPLPLGRMRARGELSELRAAELRFSDEETATFLTGALDLELSAGDVTRLQARTEGWPAALYLAALSLRGRPDPSSAIERFAGDDRYLVDYLATEVLARQPSELRSFLLHTSILERFCGSLCDAVADRRGSAALLAELERSNLLLVQLDSKREWYRYHHLFGELLQHELAATNPDAIAALHRRASTWYRDAGLIVDAAGHASAAGDLDAAIELVARHYAFFVDRGQLATVLRWLDLLPEAVAAQDWLLCFAGTVVTAHAGELDQAERWLELAERAPPVVRDGQEPAGPLALLTAYLRLLRGDIGGTVTNGRRALEAAPAADPVWALGPQMVLASALWWGGEAGEASAIVERVTAMTVYALGVRAAIALDEQDERAAETLAREAIELMRRAELDEHPWGAMAHIVHGTLLGRNRELEAAAEEIERGMELGRRQAAWQVTVCAALALAEIRQQQHEPAAARRLLTRTRDLLASLPDPGDGFSRLEQTEKSLKLRPTRGRDAVGFWELSGRELEVLRLLPTELSQREIAAELYVSFNTVRTHTRVIFQKLGVTSRAEAVARARELGLL
jgi:LuxR family maltose regulon positive regulatory protein